MTRNIMILCDPEEDYAYQLAAFLDKDKDFPWEIFSFTRLKDVEKFLSKCSADLVLIAESAFEEEVLKYAAEQIVLLNESGVLKCPEVCNVNKYQAAGEIRKELLSLYVQQKRKVYPMLQTGGKARIIGMFSPVRRCLQTTFAITYGQLLAEEQKVLHLSFECYAGVKEFFGDRSEKDMTALLYYLNGEQEKFFAHMKSLVRSVGNWEYILPMFNGENIPYITVREWLSLINNCAVYGGYDYVVLDLSENMQGLFEILRICDSIITLTREDAAGRCKLHRYEYLLERKEYDDIREKTQKYQLPVFSRLPETLEVYTRGELAEYVKGILKQRKAGGTDADGI